MRATILFATFLLSSCSNLDYDYGDPQTYVVRSGDTLYSIAFRHGLDYRDLARWNGLADADRILVGQRLVLAPRAAAAPVIRQAAAPSPSTSAVPPASGTPTFSWPARGEIVTRFGDSGVLTTGIGIAGSLGADIVAAAPGRVVYAGSGLVDYGQLVIIQHNASWLTAYGHNRSIRVAQGDSVARGEKIAEMGLGPGQTPRLYFEIRRDGNPLDPLNFLSAQD